MRICMIVPNPAVKGGIASVVNGYRGSELERKYEISYVESYRDGSKWQKLGKALGGYCSFLCQLLFHRPDIVHIHSSFGPSFYRKMPFIYLSSLWNIPVMNHIHGADFEEFYEEASAAKRKRIKKVYGKCARMLVLSEEWKDRIGRIVPSERIDILENYCKIPEEPYDSGRNMQQVLFLGEIGSRKGCYDIPDIWERVVRQVPSARLIMAGAGEVEQVKAALAQRDVTSSVIFPGWVRGEDKERLLNESAVFLFPSYHEGMPMAVLEAMSYGMGIVTTAVGGIPGLIRNGETGYIRQPGDAESMASDVIQLLTDHDGCTAIGYRARECVKENYSRDRHLERLSDIYESVAKGTRKHTNRHR